MKLHFATYEELNDLPSLVNSLRAMAEIESSAHGGVILANAATAIEGLMRERDELRRAQSKAANDAA